MPSRRRSLAYVARTILPAVAIVLAVSAAMLAGPPSGPAAADKAAATKATGDK